MKKLNIRCKIDDQIYLMVEMQHHQEQRTDCYVMYHLLLNEEHADDATLVPCQLWLHFLPTFVAVL